MTSRHHLVCTGVSCALALSSTALAAENFWDGSDSNDWNNPNNWSLNRVPVKAGFADDAAINILTNFPVITSAFSVVPQDIFIGTDATPGENGGGDLLTPNAGYGYITLTAVPEPSVAALLGGIGLLALVRRRRG